MCSLGQRVNNLDAHFVQFIMWITIALGQNIKDDQLFYRTIVGCCLGKFSFHENCAISPFLAGTYLLFHFPLLLCLKVQVHMLLHELRIYV